jgi:hypothetical protein
MAPVGDALVPVPGAMLQEVHLTLQQPPSNTSAQQQQQVIQPFKLTVL